MIPYDLFQQEWNYVQELLKGKSKGSFGLTLDDINFINIHELPFPIWIALFMGQVFFGIPELAVILFKLSMAWLDNKFGNDPTRILVGGMRPVEVILPGTYSTAVAAPLLILLHGFGGSAERIESVLRLQTLALQNGMIFLAPTGTPNSLGIRYWKASKACCDFLGAGPDDSAYILSLIEEVSSKYNVDQRRIYLAGHSNGGFMAQKMACDHSSKIAAILCMSGAVEMDTSLCRPSSKVSILTIHGTLDPTIKFDGGSLLGGAYPSAL